MALRFLQITLPDRDDLDLASLLDDREVLGTWRDDTQPDRIVIHLLVPTGETEAVMDRFEDALGSDTCFRVVMFPVEAVLPRPKDVEEDGPTENGEAPADAEGDGEDGSGGDGDEEDAAAEKAKQAISATIRISREELYSDVTETLGVDRVYLAMTSLSAVVAAVGLMRDDLAVVIGAMVIAPLLGPNVALSLAATLGDLKLVRRALLTNLAGVLTALVVSLVVGLLFTIDPKVPAIADRTGVAMSDLVLALAAGAAGTFAFTRGMSGAVIGVMVAVALVPPLATFGILLGSGHVKLSLGALMLVAANVVCINLAGVATFLVQGVRPRNWWEAERAKKATRIAITAWLVLLVIFAVAVVVTQKTGGTP